MRTIQEIFDLAIEQEAYQGIYMCDAIGVLGDCRQISTPEEARALNEINNFIQGKWSLHNFITGQEATLSCPDFAETMSVRMAIFMDWENRQELVDKFREENAELCSEVTKS